MKKQSKISILVLSKRTSKNRCTQTTLAGCLALLRIAVPHAKVIVKWPQLKSHTIHSYKTVLEPFDVVIYPGGNTFHDPDPFLLRLLSVAQYLNKVTLALCVGAQDPDPSRYQKYEWMNTLLKWLYVLTLGRIKFVPIATQMTRYSYRNLAKIYEKNKFTIFRDIQSHDAFVTYAKLSHPIIGSDLSLLLLPQNFSQLNIPIAFKSRLNQDQTKIGMVFHHWKTDAMLASLRQLIQLYLDTNHQVIFFLLSAEDKKGIATVIQGFEDHPGFFCWDPDTPEVLLGGVKLCNLVLTNSAYGMNYAIATQVPFIPVHADDDAREICKLFELKNFSLRSNQDVMPIYQKGDEILENQVKWSGKLSVIKALFLSRLVSTEKKLRNLFQELDKKKSY